MMENDEGGRLTCYTLLITIKFVDISNTPQENLHLVLPFYFFSLLLYFSSLLLALRRILNSLNLRFTCLFYVPLITSSRVKVSSCSMLNIQLFLFHFSVIL